MIAEEFPERSHREQRSRLWLPPERRPGGRHAVGNPYAWDGSPRRVRPPERAVIGDELREVAAWCELSPCVARYTYSGAAGIADIVALALADGWRKDAVGRLICPSCLQRFPIWSTAPLALMAPFRQRAASC